MCDSECERCGEICSIRYGEEPTPNCDSCAHEIVDEQQATIERLRLELAEAKEVLAITQNENLGLWNRLAEQGVER